MGLLREFCAENRELVPAAVAAGANRIELCDNLAVEGTSPSYGVIRSTVAFARECGVPVMVMCRPRGGSFVYDRAEAEMLVDDVRCARGLGASGVVLGCVAPDGAGRLRVDAGLVGALVAEAKGEGRGMAAGAAPVEVTFHMAFDALDGEVQDESVDLLARLGVDRILTHGGPAGSPIEQNLTRLRELASLAGEGVSILPGGGVTWENAEAVAAATGAREVHGTRVVRL